MGTGLRVGRSDQKAGAKFRIRAKDLEPASVDLSSRIQGISLASTSRYTTEFQDMLRSWSSLAPIPIADHEVVVFYDVDGLDIAAGPGTNFGQLIFDDRTGSLPSDQREALQGRYANDSIWRLAEPDEAGRTAFKVGEDLHPHLRVILSGARTDLATRWLPTESAKRLLARADLYQEEVPQEGRLRKAIILKYSNAAISRLSAAVSPVRNIKLDIDAFDLTLFETGKGLLQARLTFSPLDGGLPLTAIELLEAVYALSRFNSLQWVSALIDHTPVGPEFTLGTLMRDLCVQETGPKLYSTRIFTYLFTRFDAPLTVDQADLYSLYAARHYTTDYDVSPGIEGTRRVRDFATVGHTLALEGGATVVAPLTNDPLPEFLLKWRASTFHSHYLPILSLNLHEHEFLVEKTSTSLLTAQQRKNLKAKQRCFEELTRASLDFRILFRYTEVSEITMHNTFNRALREVLGLDRMQREFSGDVTEISAFLDRLHDRERADAEHKRSTRFWFLGVIGAGILAALSVSTFLKQLIEGGKTLFASQTHITLDIEQVAIFLPTVAGSLVFIGALVVGFLKRPLKERAYERGNDSGFSEEAGPEIILDQANEEATVSAINRAAPTVERN